MIRDLVFVGFNSRVAALHRDTGEVVWQWKSHKGTGCVALLLDGDRLIVSVQGYTHCLDSATGQEMWFNKLEGMGIGVPSLASARGGHTGVLLQAASSDEQNHVAARSHGTM